MGFIILFITIIGIIYLFHRLGLLNLLALFFLIFLCIELLIVIILMLCPEVIKNYLFFSGDLYTLFSSIPEDIMTGVKARAMNPLMDFSLSDAITSIPEKIKDAVLSSNDKQINLLGEILEESKKSNTLQEVQLEQFFNAKKLDAAWYKSMEGLLNSHVKSMVYAINHPTDVVTQLNGIYNASTPNFALLQEAKLSNSLVAQNNKLLLQGFSNTMSAGGAQDLAKQFSDFGQYLDATLKSYQTQATDISTKTEQALSTAMDTFQQNQAKLEANAVERVQEAQAAAEEQWKAAGDVLEDYRKNEAYQKMQNTSGSTAFPLPDQKTVEAATTGGMLYAIGRAAIRLIFKF